MIELGSGPLPKGWCWVTLADVAEVVGGVTKDIKKEADPGRTEVPYLTVANVQRGFLDLSVVKTIRAPQAKIDQLRLLPGDILFNEGGDRDKLGRGWVWAGRIDPCIHQNHVFRARLKTTALLPAWVSLFANWIAQDWFVSNGKQTTNLASLSLASLKALPIPRPPRTEQERIVATLEQQLSRIDAADASVRRANRRSIGLQHRTFDTACRRLWNGGVVPLGELLAEPLRNGHSARASRDGSGIPTVTLSAVTQGDFSLRNTKATVADPTRVQELWLRDGDILIERSNTPELVGTAALYRGPSDFAIFPDLLIRARISPPYRADYVTLALQSLALRRYFKSRAQGISGSMPKISQRTIEEALIPALTPNSQTQVVEFVQAQSVYLRSLQDQLAIVARRSKALRTSLFEYAFSGRLMLQSLGCAFGAESADCNAAVSLDPAPWASGSSDPSLAVEANV